MADKRTPLGTEKRTPLAATRSPSQTNETKPTGSGSDLSLLTFQDLNNILEVNQKAMTIYLEVERQNEEILEALGEENEKLERLETIEDEMKSVKDSLNSVLKAMESVEKKVGEADKKLSDIDKAIFKLMIILGSAGIGTIITIVQSFVGHK